MHRLCSEQKSIQKDNKMNVKDKYKVPDFISNVMDEPIKFTPAKRYTKRGINKVIDMLTTMHTLASQEIDDVSVRREKFDQRQDAFRAIRAKIEPPKKGEPKIAKQIAKIWYEHTMQKLSASDKEKIGSIYADSILNIDEQYLLFTEGADGYAEDYYNDGSCWWTEYGESRNYLYGSNGGALRIYNTYDAAKERDNSDLIFRAWWLPVMGKGIILFNLYGEYNLYQTATLLSQVFTNQQWTENRIYCDSNYMYWNTSSCVIANVHEFEADENYSPLSTTYRGGNDYRYLAQYEDVYETLGKEFCECCEEHTDEVYEVWTNDDSRTEYWCEYCRDNRTSYDDVQDRYTTAPLTETVYGDLTSIYNEDYVYCKNVELHAPYDDSGTVEVDGEFLWIEDEDIDDFFKCVETGEWERVEYGYVTNDGMISERGQRIRLARQGLEQKELL
jgi:hypothetical protein